MLFQDFCCNGTVVDDLELGKIIQLQGDQRKNVSHFLVEVILSLSPFITKFVSA
jgi:translation initiation factor 1